MVELMGSEEGNRRTGGAIITGEAYGAAGTLPPGKTGHA